MMWFWAELSLSQCSQEVRERLKCKSPVPANIPCGQQVIILTANMLSMIIFDLSCKLVMHLGERIYWTSLHLETIREHGVGHSSQKSWRLCWIMSHGLVFWTAQSPPQHSRELSANAHTVTTNTPDNYQQAHTATKSIKFISVSWWAFHEVSLKVLDFFQDNKSKNATHFQHTNSANPDSQWRLKILYYSS